MVSFIDDEYEDLMRSGKKLYQLRKYSDSIKFFKKARKIDKKRINSFLWLAKSLFRLRKFDESLYYNDILLSISPNHVAGWLLRIELFSAMYNYSEVLICCEKGFNIAKSDYALCSIYIQKSIALRQLNKLEDAKKIAQEALKKFPKSWKLLANTALIFEKLEEFDSAVSVLTSAIQIKPKDWRLWYNRGVNLFYLKKTQAKMDFKKATILNPKNERCWLMLGRTSMNNLNYALECFDNAIVANSKYVRAYENKGKVLELLGRLEESRQCYALAMNISGRNDDFV